MPCIPDGQAASAEGAGSGLLELVAQEKPLSVVAEAFRSIRTALSFTRGGAQCHQFIVTSALPSEGKTLVSVNIATVLAQTGKKVLLVDTDLRRPRIHKILNVEQSPGISSLLAGQDGLTLDDVIQVSGTANLSIISSGPLPPNPAELLGNARMEEMIKECAGRFDYVVYDTPPAINVTDATVLAQHVLGALLVVRSFVTERAAAIRARELLTAAGARLLGVVLNGVDAPRGGYYYDGYYHHHYYYGDKKEKSPRRFGRRKSAV